ncbi:MAG: hypothetical protein FWG68_07040 [Defluviitaleaceae bacterium]|nr:hypothetical protein [Defluviitaleaceae bacterium]
MRKLLLIILAAILLTSPIAAHATESAASEQFLLPIFYVWGNNGFVERSFQTLGQTNGGTLKLWHENNTPRSVIVRIQRRNRANLWEDVTSITVPANAERTRQVNLWEVPNAFNAEMRVTISHAWGYPVAGEVSVSQTTAVSRFFENNFSKPIDN